MSDSSVSRTLVKSTPELWTECSEVDSLARHLEGFGEIRITRLEPETTVAWEGEDVSGTVRLEPSGWGTRVTLTATSAAGEAEAPAAAEAEAPAATEADTATAPAAIELPEPAPEPPSAPLEPAQARIASVPPPEPEPELESAAITVDPHPPYRRPGLFARIVAFFRGPEPAVAGGGRTEFEPAEAEPVWAGPAVAPEADATAPEPEPTSREPEASVPEPEATVPDKDATEPEPEAPDAEPGPHEPALRAALDSLGQAHHRPFSRS